MNAERASWLTHRQPAMRSQPGRLVFLDETSVKTTLVRLMGRCPKGERLRGKTPFGRWQTQTFIAGLRLDGLVAPFLVPGAMNGAAFDTDITEMLAPELSPGDVVGLDNLNVHRSPRASQGPEPPSTRAAPGSSSSPATLPT